MSSCVPPLEFHTNTLSIDVNDCRSAEGIPSPVYCVCVWVCVCVCVCLFLYMLHTKYQNTYSTCKMSTFWLLLSFRRLFGLDLVLRFGLRIRGFKGKVEEMGHVLSVKWLKKCKGVCVCVCVCLLFGRGKETDREKSGHFRRNFRRE